MSAALDMVEVYDRFWPSELLREELSVLAAVTAIDVFGGPARW